MLNKKSLDNCTVDYGKLTSSNKKTIENKIVLVSVKNPLNKDKIAKVFKKYKWLLKSKENKLEEIIQLVEINCRTASADSNYESYYWTVLDNLVSSSSFSQIFTRDKPCNTMKDVYKGVVFKIITDCVNIHVFS